MNPASQCVWIGGGLLVLGLAVVLVIMLILLRAMKLTATGKPVPVEGLWNLLGVVGLGGLIAVPFILAAILLAAFPT